MPLRMSTISADSVICCICARSSTLSLVPRRGRRVCRRWIAWIDKGEAQLHGCSPRAAPTQSVGQIDETARMAALEVLARLIARMVAAQQARDGCAALRNLKRPRVGQRSPPLTAGMHPLLRLRQSVRGNDAKDWGIELIKTVRRNPSSAPAARWGFLCHVRARRQTASGQSNRWSCDIALRQGLYGIED
jgi:hypothetical protein